MQDESFLIEAEDMRDNQLFDQAVRGGRGWGWGLGLGWGVNVEKAFGD